MLDDKKIEEAARLDDKEYYDRLSDNDKCDMWDELSVPDETEKCDNQI